MSKITTYTKRKIDPCNADINDIAIEDIAHALSLLCRAGGQFPTFYSVGQHSVACVKEAKARGYSEKIQLMCLLHDASEAYIADITRPVKHELSNYLIFEKKLQTKIYEKYLGTVPNEDEQKLIDSVDDAMLYYEFKVIMDYEIMKGDFKLSTTLDTKFDGFEKTEKEFLLLFHKLYCR